ncbi:hypothetical protein [Methanothermococcus sp.]|uniref:hypothetical protein n=1 Tax=Methanothermococcus sp. TaxID=2614238 RepID=UPI0025E557E8|nr:hypothetical protein [Methanothermococcus sp.]
MELEDKKELYDKVLDYFMSSDNKDIFFEELKKEIQVEDIFLVDTLEELIEDGEIYEPRDGVYRVL